MTTERATADTETAHKLSFVAYAYLTQLDARSEHSRKVLDELAEIDPALSGEIEDELAVVKRILNIDELHIEPVLSYLFNAGIVRVYLFPEIIAMYLLVRLCSTAEHRAQRR